MPTTDYSERSDKESKKEARRKKEDMLQLDIADPHSIKDMLKKSGSLQTEVIVISDDGSENTMKMMEANLKVKQGKTKLNFMEEREGVKVFRLRTIIDTTAKPIQITDNITERDLQIKVRKAVNLLMKGKRIDFKLKGRSKPTDRESIKQIEKQVDKFIHDIITEIIPEDEPKPEFTLSSTDFIIMLRPV